MAEFAGRVHTKVAAQNESPLLDLHCLPSRSRIFIGQIFFDFGGHKFFLSAFLCCKR